MRTFFTAALVVLLAQSFTLANGQSCVLEVNAPAIYFAAFLMARPVLEPASQSENAIFKSASGQVPPPAAGDGLNSKTGLSDSNPPYESIQFRGSPSGQIVQKTFTYSLDDLASNEVIIKVTDSGLCFTDIHMLKKDMCLGHEGVGIVQAVGSGCKTVKVGDRVGWGYANSKPVVDYNHRDFTTVYDLQSYQSTCASICILAFGGYLAAL
ncbi:hypothetical protein D9758_004972 [Tetrapyrgos nigripes]|uniref:Alcohol dehydrogenase-like N-terminal domain-containing protein n=1 Tax=Tetrapyrgos nigripes TaxID=182062 RepID=A0A8H5GWM1_9AGAR|nr:hypothetical protein D9758_004972 [Tetrapyrgos nigripes]